MVSNITYSHSNLAIGINSHYYLNTHFGKYELRKNSYSNITIELRTFKYYSTRLVLDLTYDTNTMILNVANYTGWYKRMRKNMFCLILDQK